MQFEEIYKNRPDIQGIGSSGYSRLKHLYDYCKKINPTFIIESGTWKGNSSYLFRHACPNSIIWCYDINFNNLKWKSNSIHYMEHDIERVEDLNINNLFYEGIMDPDKTLLFFDDHVNQDQRLEWAMSKGFKHVIFDDNIPTNDLHNFKAPPTPTLQMLKESGDLPDLKQYKVLPQLSSNKKTYLTYIEIY